MSHDAGQDIQETRRAVRLATLQEAARRSCQFCADGVARFHSTPTKVDDAWAHKPNMTSPLWGDLSCRAGALHDMMEELNVSGR